MENNSLMLVDNNGSFEIDDQSHMDVDASRDHSMTLFTPTRPNEDGPNADTDEGSLPEPATQPGKRRRKKSMVWEHFTIETASPGSTKACCKHCRKSFAYITGQKLAGTSHLKRHIQLGICPMSRDSSSHLAQITESKDRSTGPPKKRQRSSASFLNVPLDQDHCYNEMAKMIIMHEYPLHMVEHSGFTGFVKSLRPQFNMASFNTIHADCVTMYLSEKQKLSNFINEIPGRVNLTIDLWTSNQSVGYAFVTGHFIDRDWKLTQRLLNVAVVPSPDSDYALNQPIAACLSDWNLERRLSSLTVGQSVVNKNSIENLRCCLSARNQHVMNGQLLLGNCYARLLSSMAQDLLGTEDLQTPIKKVRDSVKYVKTSDSCGERFDELKRQLQCPTKDLLIDNQTKWDTSYNMLLAACEHKEVFSCLGNCDLDYKISTSPEEWGKIEILCSCLKILFDAANVLTRPTLLKANEMYHEMTKLQLDLSHAAMSEDPDVRNLANPLKEKFDEYWRGCFLLLAVAVVMDPRFKMKLIEFGFSKVYGEDAEKWIRNVDDAVHDLYHDYAEQSHSLLDAYVDHGNDGFVDTDMSQVHFHHEAPHEYHHSNGVSHDQTYEQPEDGNPLNEKPKDHVVDGQESQEVAQTQVNQLSVEESLPHAQEEKTAEPLLQEDQSGGMGPQENQPMEGISEEGQQKGTVSVGGNNTTQGLEQEGHLVDAGTEENHIVEGLSGDSKPMEGLTQDSLLREENLQANGEPTLAQLTDEVSHESQAMEETRHATQSAEEVAHETQLVEEFPCESQPEEEIPQETRPVEDTDMTQESQLREGNVLGTQPVEEILEDTDMTQESQPREGNVPETHPVKEFVEDTQPVEEVPQVSQPIEDIPNESHPIEEVPVESQQVDDNDITHETQPVEEMLEDTQPVEEVSQETQLVEEKHNEIEPVEEVGHDTQVEEKHDEIEPVKEVGHETQVEEMLEDTQPAEEVAQEAQLVEEKHDDIQPVEEAGHETQPVEGILENTQPVKEVAPEAQPVEQIPEQSQTPQNADGSFQQEYPREGEAVPQEQQSTSEKHPSAVDHVEETQVDSRSHAMPQEEAAFTISQEGHHVDVLLQEGHHLEASSQEFPLITIGDGFSDFELYISEVGGHQQIQSEVDQYLEESLIPRTEEFEVLSWWSLNRTKYPTLSKMAADILSLPFCTVPADSVFDTEVKKMDNYRSSLRHVTLEALFCAKDWFKHSSTSENNLKRES